MTPRASSTFCRAVDKPPPRTVCKAKSRWHRASAVSTPSPAQPISPVPNRAAPTRGLLPSPRRSRRSAPPTRARPRGLPAPAAWPSYTPPRMARRPETLRRRGRRPRISPICIGASLGRGRTRPIHKGVRHLRAPLTQMAVMRRPLGASCDLPEDFPNWSWRRSSYNDRVKAIAVTCPTSIGASPVTVFGSADRAGRPECLFFHSGLRGK